MELSQVPAPGPPHEGAPPPGGQEIGLEGGGEEAGAAEAAGDEGKPGGAGEEVEFIMAPSATCQARKGILSYRPSNEPSRSSAPHTSQVGPVQPTEQAHVG